MFGGVGRGVPVVFVSIIGSKWTKERRVDGSLEGALTVLRVWRRRGQRLIVATATGFFYRSCGCRRVSEQALAAEPFWCGGSCPASLPSYMALFLVGTLTWSLNGKSVRCI